MAHLADCACAFPTFRVFLLNGLNQHIHFCIVQFSPSFYIQHLRSSTNQNFLSVETNLPVVFASLSGSRVPGPGFILYLHVINPAESSSESFMGPLSTLDSRIATSSGC